MHRKSAARIKIALEDELSNIQAKIESSTPIFGILTGSGFKALNI